MQPLDPSAGFFNEIGGLAVLWVGAYLVLEGQLTIGQLIAFRIISGNVVGPIIRLSRNLANNSIACKSLLNDLPMLLMRKQNSRKIPNQLLCHQFREKLNSKMFPLASILIPLPWLSR